MHGNRVFVSLIVSIVDLHQRRGRKGARQPCRNVSVGELMAEARTPGEKQHHGPRPRLCPLARPVDAARLSGSAVTDIRGHEPPCSSTYFSVMLPLEPHRTCTSSGAGADPAAGPAPVLAVPD